MCWTYLWLVKSSFTVASFNILEIIFMCMNILPFEAGHNIHLCNINPNMLSNIEKMVASLSLIYFYTFTCNSCYFTFLHSNIEAAWISIFKLTIDQMLNVEGVDHRELSPNSEVPRQLYKCFLAAFSSLFYSFVPAGSCFSCKISV